MNRSLRRRSEPRRRYCPLRVERLEERCLLAGALPEMLDDRLGVRRVVTGLTTPTSFAVVGGTTQRELLVLEKTTGKVQHVVGGAIQGTALDLAVNNASERGLLGIALHPDFPTTPLVYLFWTARTAAPPADPFVPDVIQPPTTPDLGADTSDVLSVPLLGNRVDRFVWNGTSLVFDQNVAMLRAFQNDGGPTPAGQGDSAQPPAGNHNGGVITFGADGKLYVILGDVGRRGQLQNLPSGPTATGLGPTVPDDQFGGPEPDNAHFTGVILRLNDDGTTPTDNPFFSAGAAIGGEVGTNIQRTFAYGIRNSFGMAVDPFTGRLWATENGADCFDELNLVLPGFNSGWIQVMGPLARLATFKKIEATTGGRNLQQLRWSPQQIAGSQAAAVDRLFELPSSHYSDPKFSWKFVVPPTALEFVQTRALGDKYFGDLLLGNGAGQLMDFTLTPGRWAIKPAAKNLRDRVDDNATRSVARQSQRLVIGEDFGIITDIQFVAGGRLLVSSLTKGTVYEVFRKSSSSSAALPADVLAVLAPVAEAGTSESSSSIDGSDELFFQLGLRSILASSAARLQLGEPGAGSNAEPPAADSTGTTQLEDAEDSTVLGANDDLLGLLADD